MARRNRPDEPLTPADDADGDMDLAAEESPDAIEATDEVAAVVRALEAERDEAVEGRLRALADFRNFQRRAEENERRALQSGAVRVVRSILPALDHFDLTLSQNPDQLTTRQLLDGVRIVYQEIMKALGGQGVERIEPVAGEPFDPHRHEAVMRHEAPGAPPNSIVATMQPGFAMGDLVLRPAKVSVAPGHD